MTIMTLQVQSTIRGTIMFMHVYASGGKTAPVVAHVFENGHFCPSHAHVTLRHWIGGVLTFMLACVTCTCYVTSHGGC